MSDPLSKTLTLSREEARAVERALEREIDRERELLHPLYRDPAALLPIRTLGEALKKVREA